MSDDLLEGILDGEEGGGGGTGVFGKFRLFACVKTLMSGLTLDQSFVEYDPTDETSYNDAVTQLKNVVTTAGGDPGSPKARPAKAIGITVYADDVVGKAWSKDMTRITMRWWEAWTGKEDKPGIKHYITELAKSGQLKAGGFGKNYWGHLTVFPDPGGYKEKDQDGNERVRMVWAPDQIFPNKAACVKAAESAGAGSSDNGIPAPPDGYTPAMWKDFYPKIKKALADGTDLSTVAEDYGVSVEFLQTL